MKRAVAPRAGGGITSSHKFLTNSKMQFRLAWTGALQVYHSFNNIEHAGTPRASGGITRLQQFLTKLGFESNPRWPWGIHMKFPAAKFQIAAVRISNEIPTNAVYIRGFQVKFPAARFRI